MITKQARSNKQIQSILYLTLLFSTLILTTGCFGNPEGNVINTRSRTSQNYDRFPNPGSPYPHTQTNPYTSSSSIILAEDLDNGGQFIEHVVENFVGMALTGAITNITVNFHNDTVIINIWDEEALNSQYPFVATLYLDQNMNGISYSDDQGTVYFEMTEDMNISQISFENADGTSGVLGYIEVCRVEGTC